MRECSWLVAKPKSVSITTKTKCPLGHLLLGIILFFFPGISPLIIQPFLSESLSMIDSTEKVVCTTGQVLGVLM